MVPERGAHPRGKAAVYKALERAIARAGLDCQAHPDGATIEIGDCDYEPDAMVNCGQPIAHEAVAAPNPVIVVEVLSPGTASTDTGAKLAGYFSLPSIMHCLIVHPIRWSVTYRRRMKDGISTVVIVNGPIRLDPPGITTTID